MFIKTSILRASLLTQAGAAARLLLTHQPGSWGMCGGNEPSLAAVGPLGPPLEGAELRKASHPWRAAFMGLFTSGPLSQARLGSRCCQGLELQVPLLAPYDLGPPPVPRLFLTSCQA